MKDATGEESQADLQNEIAELEDRLRRAKERLETSQSSPTTISTTNNPHHAARAPPSPSLPLPSHPNSNPHSQITAASNPHHYLLLLSDSALPLGSFAFSSGLESYREHARTTRSPAPFASFLPLSVSSLAATSLPFALAAHRDPRRLRELDDALDAATPCAVARRASVAQGRALLGVWEKSFAPASTATGGGDGDFGSGAGAANDGELREVLKEFSALLRSGSGSGSGSRGAAEVEEEEEGIPPQQVSAHFAPLFGAVARALGLTARQAAYVFVLGHVRNLTSAAMRAGVFGPFQAQKILAGAGAQRLVAAAIDREWDTPFEDAGQTAPVLDLWVGRHEILYSKIFNS
ncbi:hypothetical protein DL764_003628 [Monosporascus ibericus]|uniref:Urease accessory protein UreF n=1 Tax=Monosporascus ibericus TaxID=155417 RepID=A0A4Q4TKB2_9PEZI|nr:hypothetical protein DL764_003628 [Monosporascus ibericus]